MSVGYISQMTHSVFHSISGIITTVLLSTTQPATPPQTGNSDVSALIEPIRQSHHLPSLGAAIITENGLVASGVTGVRKVDATVSVTIDDLWHLGSDTKAMTAVVIATLVERGKLTWDTTIGDVFPEFART